MNENMTFEQQLARLEEIVAALEKGDAPLPPVPGNWTWRSSRWSS